MTGGGLALPSPQPMAACIYVIELWQNHGQQHIFKNFQTVCLLLFQNCSCISTSLRQRSFDANYSYSKTMKLREVSAVGVVPRDDCRAARGTILRRQPLTYRLSYESAAHFLLQHAIVQAVSESTSTKSIYKRTYISVYDGLWCQIRPWCGIDEIKFVR